MSLFTLRLLSCGDAARASAQHILLRTAY